MDTWEEGGGVGEGTRKKVRVKEWRVKRNVRDGRGGKGRYTSR